MTRRDRRRFWLTTASLTVAMIAMLALVVWLVGFALASSATSARADSEPALPPVSELADPNKPGWIVDELHGCWLWILRLQPEGAAKWSGACSAAGPAEGTGVLDFQYAGGGVRYEGSMEDGRVSGFGIMFYANGDRYEGFWRQDTWDGSGVYLSANGDRYDGGWSNGEPSGYGEAILSGQPYSGIWSHGCLKTATGVVGFFRSSECAQ